LDIIYGNYRLSDYTKEIDQELNTGNIDTTIESIGYLIENFKQKYDYILIDLPPDLYSLNKVFLAYSDYILLVLNIDVFAKVTLKLVEKHFYQAKDVNPLFQKLKKETKIHWLYF